MKNSLTYLSIAIFVFLVGFAFFLTQGREDSEEKIVISDERLEELRSSFELRNRRGVQGKALGNPEAPIHFIEYSDYSCEHCVVFWSDVLPSIEEGYIDEGLVYYEYKDFPIVGGEVAAEAAHCAGEQGAFWQYHDALFSRYLRDRHLWGGERIHKEYSLALGLDGDSLIDCLRGEKYRNIVEENTEEASRLGGMGTPFFVINDISISGLRDFEFFEEIIEEELEKIYSVEDEEELKESELNN